MDKFSLYAPNFLPCKEYFDPKLNTACPGCGLALAVRHIYKAVEKSITKAVWEEASGADLLGEKTSASFLKIKQGKTELLVCLDNEAGEKLEGSLKKKLPGIAAAKGFKYVATACPSYPFDLYEKAQRAMETEGKAYLHILCPCPEGWQFDCENTVKVGFKAVESLAFPLYEIASGHYTQTIKTMKPIPVTQYIKAQGRFESATEKQITHAESVVEKEYAKLDEILKSQLAYTFETTGEVY